jgi:hypothetical protein
MATPPPEILVEHCDVPEGMRLSDWRARTARPPRRRAQVASGVLAAVATLAPAILSVRAARRN